MFMESEQLWKHGHGFQTHFHPTLGSASIWLGTAPTKYSALPGRASGSSPDPCQDEHPTSHTILLGIPKETIYSLVADMKRG